MTTCKCGAKFDEAEIHQVKCDDCYIKSFQSGCKDALYWVRQIYAYALGYTDAFKSLRSEVDANLSIKFWTGIYGVSSRRKLLWNCSIYVNGNAIKPISDQYEQRIDPTTPEYLFDEFIKQSWLYVEQVTKEMPQVISVSGVIGRCLICDTYDVGNMQRNFICHNCRDKHATAIEKAPSVVDIAEIGKLKNRGYVYLIKSPTGAYKIGKTKNPKDRMRMFHIKVPFEIEIEHLVEVEDMQKLERGLHTMFRTKRINGEWFNLSEDDVQYIKSL
jgi:hypothetical protein